MYHREGIIWLKYRKKKYLKYRRQVRRPPKRRRYIKFKKYFNRAKTFSTVHRKTYKFQGHFSEYCNFGNNISSTDMVHLDFLKFSLNPDDVNSISNYYTHFLLIR